MDYFFSGSARTLRNRFWPPVFARHTHIDRGGALLIGILTTPDMHILVRHEASWFILFVGKEAQRSTHPLLRIFALAPPNSPMAGERSYSIWAPLWGISATGRLSLLKRPP